MGAETSSAASIQEKSPHEITFRLNQPGSAAEFHIKDWKNLKINQSHKYIQPGQMVQKVLDNESFLKTASIDNREAFRSKILAYMHKPQTLRQVGAESFDQLTSKQIIMACVAYTTSHLTYDEKLAQQIDDHEKHLKPTDPWVKQYEKYLATPIDKMSKGVCIEFAMMNEAAFRLVKPTFGAKLQNIYMDNVASNGFHMNHAWNDVIQVDAPDNAEIAYLDPTSAIDDLGEAHNVVVSKSLRNNYNFWLHNAKEQHIIQ